MKCIYSFAIFCIVAVVKSAAQNVQSECGKPQLIVETRILHGDDTSRGEYPWHVAVFHASLRSVENVCGGTLISRRHVLTAAHCVMNQDTKYPMARNQIFVEVGAHELNLADKDKQRHNIKAVHKLDKYSSDSPFYDIAVLELESAVVVTQYVQPACVYLKKDLVRKVGTVVGFGLTEQNQLSSVLKKVRMPVIDILGCLESNRDTFGPTLSRGMFCAGHINGTGVCNGDSGGGFVVEMGGAWHVAGIVSYTAAREGDTALCQTHGYAIFTRIYDYIPWLNNVTKLNYGPREEASSEETTDTDYCEAKPANGPKISAASAFPANCGLYTPDRVYKGEQTTLFEFPWMATLIDVQKSIICFGTLINKRYVLSSGFCTDARIPKQVRLGEHTLNKHPNCNAEQVCAPPPRMYDVECVIRHQQYKRYLVYNVQDNDIALIRTNQEVEFEAHIQPICLPITSELRKMVLPQYIATGWGRTSDDKDNVKYSLHKALITLVNKGKCTIFDVLQLCIGDVGSANYCWEDNGAPFGNAVQFNGLRFVQFGIISSGGCYQRASVATDVTAHMDWIMANVKV